MTEAEWLSCGDPYDLLRHASTRDPRKRRLLCCACARRVLHLVPDQRFSAGVAASEDHADALLTWDQLKASARRNSTAAKQEYVRRFGNQPARYAAESVHATTNRGSIDESMNLAAAAMGYCASDYDSGLERELAEQFTLIRDIFGNPFRPVAFDPSWRTEAVVSLARGMYESRDFAPMPVLADALEDAGCTQPDVLAHGRGPGPHVRGCWVVDLVLGKA